jgi:simple sugar transport system ATP-binding protein
MRVELRGITKSFGPLVANDDVSLTVEPGEVHALLGENGAGKSTLMNVLFGMLRADAGEIVVDGEVATLRNPGDAIARGLGMVHQHFMLVPVFTVAENVVLGDEPTRGRQLLDRKRARERIHEVSAQYGLEVEPDARIEDLPVGIQQRVEILKALNRDARCLILDEPTAVLTPLEIQALFAIMRSLTASGHSVLFITHKLKEVLEVADRITVMRRGKVVGTTTPATTSEQELAEMMVGRAVMLTVDKPPASPAAPVLTVEDLRGQARSSRSPASRATARARSWRRSQACGSHFRATSAWMGATRPARAPARCSAAVSRTSPRTGSSTGWLHRCRSRTTCSSTSTWSSRMRGSAHGGSASSASTPRP